MYFRPHITTMSARVLSFKNILLIYLIIYIHCYLNSSWRTLQKGKQEHSSKTVLYIITLYPICLLARSSSDGITSY